MRITVRNPASIPVNDLNKTVPLLAIGQPNPNAVIPWNFPTSTESRGNPDAAGNDDSNAVDESDNPYELLDDSNNQGGNLNHQKGQVTSIDAPWFDSYPQWTAAPGATFDWDGDFVEFVRVELWDGERKSGKFWFRISDETSWHHSLRVIKNPADDNWGDRGSSSSTGFSPP